MGADLDTDALLGPFRDFDKGFPLMTAGLPRVLLRSAYAGRDAIRTLVRDQIRRARLLPADGRPAPEIDSLPRGETFNLTNSDVLVWEHIWPVIAAAASLIHACCSPAVSWRAAK